MHDFSQNEDAPNADAPGRQPQTPLDRPRLRDVSRYLGCAETAKLIRAALRKAFPGIVFRVHARSHDLAACVFVSYTDGPSLEDVDAIVDAYNGKGFDGSIDMAYRFKHWLLPDGSAIPATCDGTQSSMGAVSSFISDPPHPDAELVQFGTSTSVSRDVWSDRKFAGKRVASVLFDGDVTNARRLVGQRIEDAAQAYFESVSLPDALVILDNDGEPWQAVISVSMERRPKDQFADWINPTDSAA